MINFSSLCQRLPNQKVCYVLRSVYNFLYGETVQSYTFVFSIEENFLEILYALIQIRISRFFFWLIDCWMTS